jgi:hypothetical protein
LPCTCKSSPDNQGRSGLSNRRSSFPACPCLLLALRDISIGIVKVEVIEPVTLKAIAAAHNIDSFKSKTFTFQGDEFAFSDNQVIQEFDVQ